MATRLMAARLALSLGLFCAVSSNAATEEQLSKRFTVDSGGNLIVEVDFGTITVNTNGSGEVRVDVWRKIGRRSKADEEAFLRENPVQFSNDGGTVKVVCRASKRVGWSWLGGMNRNEAKYTITVPATFNARLTTAGGGIEANDLTGEVKANTSGGGLRFARLKGPLDGGTSGGGIHVQDCKGILKIHTSGGGIDVAGGAGSLNGGTSGGSVTVKEFGGPVQVETSGGGVTIENAAGDVSGSTSGGSIRAVLPEPLPGTVKLSTSGGGVTVRVSEKAAFNLDAETSGSGVSSDLPVTVQGKIQRDRLVGPVNGGGKSVWLRSSGGSIHIKKQ